MDRRPRGVVPAALEHLEEVISRMRQEHVRELGAGFAATARHSFRTSVVAYAAIRSGHPIFAMGVEPAGLLTASAVVWMLGTEDIDRHPAFTFRVARWGIGEAYRATGALRLEQWIPEWYRTGLRFVERLGFIQHRPESPIHENCLVRVTHERRRIA